MPSTSSPSSRRSPARRRPSPSAARVMMQAEKIAGDLNEAYDGVAGNASPVPALAAAMRRLERRGAQAPALVEPAIAALDAGAHRRSTRRAPRSRPPLRATEFDPRELERTEERLFALRAAAANTTCRPTSSPPSPSAIAAGYRGHRRGRGAPRRARAGARRGRGGLSSTAAKALSAARQKAAEALDAAVEARAAAAQARAGPLHHRDRSREPSRRRGRLRPRRVLGADQSRHARPGR